MQKLKKSPALERIRELFRYDAHSGIFTRAVTNRRWKEGEPAGCVDKDGYILINVDGMQHRAHRLAWLYVHGKMPEHDIDHINGIRTDNRLCNLRDVSRLVNLQNRRVALCASGLIGAHFHKHSGLWFSRIRSNGAPISLGYFKTPEEANAAYVAAKRLLHAGCTL